MLTDLKISNFGLIENLEIEFAPGLNVLTGSTGAGKSIIIDGLRLALGERLKNAQIRDKNNPCRLQAVFEIPGRLLQQHPLLAERLEQEQTLIIDRQIFTDNRSKIKINGNPVTVGQLKEIGDLLIDFHGPHDHQRLLDESSHIFILDQLTDFKGQKKAYRAAYEKFLELKKDLTRIQQLALSRDRDLDLLRHQVKELSQVSLSEEDYEDLCRQQAQVNNAQRLQESSSELIDLFEQENIGISERIRQGFSPLKDLQDHDALTENFQDVLLSIQEQSDQLVSELKSYRDQLSFDPRDAQTICRQYDVYQDIKRKYGPTLKDARSFLDKAEPQLELLENLQHNDEQLRKQLDQQTQALKDLADKLTKARKHSARQLSLTIKKELQDLGIRKVDFEAKITPSDFHPLGQDAVAFYISPNAGEALKPLSQIVSSGEAARVMLALKKALIHVDPVPVLIFDEIDAQIGGRLGAVTGRKLKELSHARQVLLITHLPQIASFADNHHKVEKSFEHGRTLTRVRPLADQARIAELTQMMSGDSRSTISVSHAEDMLAQARQ